MGFSPLRRQFTGEGAVEQDRKKVFNVFTRYLGFLR
jgi:hypothetical protein